ncbi:hypothetical protein [Chryseobacterium populi]|uniref:Bacterial sensory transduction regulator n=1 Tax=Chryseobacterium populi TaxID=1144316 RepID=J3CL68_9FLAO|nr:hypothetical protein [Chryseobacterium populi]EJL73786.1 hypothetical protein PMI13_01359 [Chryseobacterium populi]
MKTKLVTTLLICFLVNLFTAQTLVKPADISISAIATHLKSKGYEILEQKETFIKIGNKDKATLFMDIDTGKKYLNMNVNILLNKGVSKEKIDHLLNEINGLAMIKADYLANQNAIGFQYYFWIANGFTYETLEDAILEFFLYQGDSYALDKEKLFDYQ